MTVVRWRVGISYLSNSFFRKTDSQAYGVTKHRRHFTANNFNAAGIFFVIHISTEINRRCWVIG